MNRHNAFANGYAANKKRDDDEYHRVYSDRSDLESKYIWGMQDLVEEDKADPSFYRP